MAAEPTHASPSLSGGAGLATTPAVDPVTSNVTAEVPQDVPAPGHLPLEADDDAEDNGDGDSTYSAGVGSETDSIQSSVLRFRVENGRTYHAYKAGAYFMPNDDRENERMDIQHNLMLMMQDGKLYQSPIGKDKPIGRVLDAGCGTGVWAVDFADEHPEASVVGTDLSPIQPEFTSPNLEFFVDDIEAPWTYTRPFDFVYMRMLCGSIMDWPKLVGQAFEHMAPGGWIEISDPVNPYRSDDGTLSENSALSQWNALLVEASIKMGRSLDVASRHKQLLIDAGFVNVVQKEFKWPSNDWPRDNKYKEIGAWSYEVMTSGLQGISLMLFTKVLGWSVEEVELLLVDVRKDYKNRKVHAYLPVYVVYGQKPE